MAIDIIVLTILLCFAVFGVIDGFIVSVFKLAAWVFGFLSAWLFAGSFANALSANIEGIPFFLAIILGGLIAFLLPFLSIVIAREIFLFIIKKSMALKTLNRLAGGGVGILKGIIVAILFLTIIHFLPAQGALKVLRESSTTYSIYTAANISGLWQQLSQEKMPAI